LRLIAPDCVYARRRFKLTVPQTAAQLALFGLVSTISQVITPDCA
jgi:hypothetical protein